MPRMDRTQIVRELKSEIARLQSAVRALEPQAHAAAPAKKKRKQKVWTDAERKAMSFKMKAIAAKRKAKG
jgi:hypothetical protein